MNRLLILLLTACLAVGTFTGCKEKEADAPKGIVVPTTDIDSEWKDYVQQVAKSKFIPGKSKAVYVRFLAATEDPTPHLKDTQNIFMRNPAPGTVLVFGSNNSRNMADLLVSAFTMEGIDGKLSGSRLVFIGRREDEARVRDSTGKSGVSFEFHPFD
jgi:hypothetical protein